MRVWIAISVSLVAALSSCESNSPDEPPIGDLPSQDTKSGTRLKLLWDSFDGAKFKSDFVYRDSLREEHCLPQLWADGNLYCSPPPAEVVYEDAACTRPMGFVDADDCAGPPPQTGLFSADEPSACTGRTMITGLRRGELRSPVPYYTKSDTGCALGTNPAGGLYTLGETVPASAFVKLSLERAGKGRIQHSYANGEDGSRLYLGTYDPLLEGDCFWFPGFDRQSRTCMILGSASINEYSDATCTQPKASAQSSCPAPKIAMGTAPMATCPDDFAAYRLGAPTAATPLYDLDENDTCSAVSPEPDTSYFSLGERLTVQRLTREPIAAGGARIKPITYTDGADQFWFGELYDTQLDAQCRSSKMADGSTRCVPDDLGLIETYYTDAACSQQLRVLIHSSVPIPCLTLQSPRVVRVDSQACGADPQLFSVGAAYTGAVYQKVGTLCFAYPAIPGVTYHTLTPLPLSELPVATQGVDP